MQGETNAFAYINELYVIAGVDPVSPLAVPKEQETLSDKVERIDHMVRGLVDGQNNPFKPGPLPDAAAAVKDLPKQVK